MPEQENRIKLKKKTGYQRNSKRTIISDIDEPTVIQFWTLQQEKPAQVCGKSCSNEIENKLKATGTIINESLN